MFNTLSIIISQGLQETDGFFKINNVLFQIRTYMTLHNENVVIFQINNVTFSILRSRRRYKIRYIVLYFSSHF